MTSTPEAESPTGGGKIYPLHEEPSDGLVLCCSDSRFLEAIDHFLLDQGIRAPVFIAVPGSSKSFGLQTFLPKQWHALRHQIELMASRNAHLQRVVLIAHEDCLAYAAHAHLLGGVSQVLSAQHEHLRGLAEFVRKEFLPSARVEFYQARIVPNGSQKGVVFVALGAV